MKKGKASSIKNGTESRTLNIEKSNIYIYIWIEINNFQIKSFMQNSSMRL